MKAIVFRNTDTGQHHKYKDALKNFKLGYAYETNTHFVYFPGYQEGFHGIQANMAITEGKSGSLEDWVKKVFGAKDIVDMVLEVGDSIDSVWYPGLYFLNQVEQAVNIKEPEMRSAEQSLRLLIAQLDDLLLYIEPENEGLKTYGHKTRQLLLLACTEVENSWKYYMKMTGTTASGRYFNTNDYVRLVDKLHLKNYKLNLRMYSAVPDITPFLNWTSNNSTESIDWYDAYNKTKHDREAHFSEATLWNCIQAVCANVIMYCARFSPFYLFDQRGNLSALTNQHFKMELINPLPSDFYLFNLILPPNWFTGLCHFEAYNRAAIVPFNVTPFHL